MKKRALITGITGQDGSYLSELLLDKGYEVHGLIRRASVFNTERIAHLIRSPEKGELEGVTLHYGELTDGGRLHRLIFDIAPDEIYHLGAQSHVRVSFDIPEYTAEVVALGTLKLLEAIQSFRKNTKKEIKFYNAASSEMFGVTPPPQNERSPFRPQSPYAIAKIFAYHSTVHAREAYGLFACNGILFNHESPRRGETFVTRKITRGIAKIKTGEEKKIYLGNLEAKRDWGYAPEYVEMMWRMLQQPQPEDFVIATGESHSVREFLEAVFQYAGLGDYQPYVELSERYLRPTDVENLCGDAAKAREKLGWAPKITFQELVKILVDYDLQHIS